jgi:transposase
VEFLDLFPIEALEGCEREGAEPQPAPQPPQHLKPKYIAVNRHQLVFQETDLEQLIPADHLVRAIWQVVCGLDLSAFEAGFRSRVELQGAPRWDPRVLITALVYGYATGVGSGRALERMMLWEPALRWLTADQEINYHTLTSFRTAHEEKLKDLFAQLLVTLEGEGLVEFKTLMQDGTKVRARASRSSFHCAASIGKRVEEARQYMQALDQAGNQEPAEEQRRERQRRNLQSQVERMEKALEAIRARSGKEDTRASTTEPEARVMKQPQGGGYAPSYNVQVVSDAKEGLIVGVRVVDAPADAQELVPMMDQLEKDTGKQPEQMVADSGYTSRENIEELDKRGIEFLAPEIEDSQKGKGNLSRTGVSQEFHRASFVPVTDGNALRCPAGKLLVFKGERKHHQVWCGVYEARAEDCGGCPFKTQCCPQRKYRVIEKPIPSAAMQAFQERMATEEARVVYKRRSQICEFPNLYFKERAGLRRFHVTGLRKVQTEVLWVALTFNLVRTLALRKRRKEGPAAA